MTGITYRPYQAADAPAIHEILNEAFFIYRYAKNPKLRGHVLQMYLPEFLLRSSYSQVAVRGDGTPVGILLARVEGEELLPHQTRNRLKVLWHRLAITATGFKERKTLAQHFSFDRAYRKLRKQAESARTTELKLTDELTLFAVAQETRGLGVGRTLYQNYLDHLHSRGRTDFYLYTDSLCTVDFYEARGLRRVAEEPMTLNFQDGSGDLAIGVYLYKGQA